MLIKNHRQTLELFFIFSLFFLSNGLAFAYAFWIVPQLVMLDSLLWFVLTTFFLWILIQQKMISVFVERLKKNWILLPFLVFSGLSILWSVYWEISLHRWFVLACTILTGGYIGLRYDLKEIIRLLSVFGIYILFLGTLFVFFIPHIGIMNYYIVQGAWKGLYWHKNHMGLVATFINILFLINIIDALPSKAKSILLWGALYVYSLLFIYQTDSVAAYLTTMFLHGLILCALVLLKFREKIRKIHYLILMIVLFVASLVLYLNLDHFFGIFNRSTSLTGRMPMWAYLFESYINKQPLFGYGFNAFWYIDAHRVSIQQAAGYPDPIIIADNGFIDILVNAGYVGLVLFLLFYVGMWWRSVRYASQARNINGLFPLILMSYSLMANISWSLIFENEGFFMLMMVSVLFCISGGISPHRGER